ncbi:hypothetical protein NL108_017699 [Boleophthalmus pectinirostris]|nr:hypothetical protein NL108_017699 [Boleophthalmus pectinirostris]
MDEKAVLKKQKELVKHMEKEFPGSTKYLEKWQKRYGFKPTLEKEQLDELINQLLIHNKQKKRSREKGTAAQHPPSTAPRLVPDQGREESKRTETEAIVIGKTKKN